MMITLAALMLILSYSNAWACDPVQLEEAEAAIGSHKIGWTISAIRSCPDLFCASYGRRLMIFNSTPHRNEVIGLCVIKAALGEGN